ncbi:MAG: phosphomannomutase [Candidatus Cloacimonadota bacterium]|nr:phosphomannomutase [Candidatus Cloacimonadota bacterium]
MASVSGVRGIFGESLTPPVVQKYVAGFAMFQMSTHGKGKIIVGRDSRTTGEAMMHIVASTLMSIGLDVCYLGIASTPTILLAVEDSDAIGGIAITASHNPPQWNAMKFVDADGMFLAPDKATAFLSSLDKETNWASWQEIGTFSVDNQAIKRHIDKILAIPYLDIQKIKDMKLKVVLDSVNGAGAHISETLLKTLGCEVISINSEPTGIFAHPAEPLNQNLSQLEQAVQEHKADLGFATDPDVDRLSIVSDQGNCIGEELSVALSEIFVLPKNPGDVVVNLSTSMLSDYLAKRYGVKVHRTKVGEINVGKKMQAISSPIGGEGNGGIICPEVHYTRDAPAGMALILGLLAETGKSISELVNELPKYYFVKDKISLKPEEMEAAMLKAKDILSGYEIDTQDGIKGSKNDHWIHIRKSGTEPIIRVYVESDALQKSEQICRQTLQKLIS